MIIQIYEIGNPTEAEKIAELGVDHIGVLVGKGKHPHEISYELSKEIFGVLPENRKGVALSLSYDLEEIFELIKEVRPDILHLGVMPKHLSPTDVIEIKRQFPQLKIMRTIPVINEDSIKLAKQYESIADYLLLDTYKREDNLVGATGEIHDWGISRRIIDSVKISTILAGGLGPDNIAAAIENTKPAGVDSKTKTDKINSNEKDINKVREFVKIIRSLE